MIAATAVVHLLTMVPRNVRDFGQLGVETLKPPAGDQSEVGHRIGRGPTEQQGPALGNLVEESRSVLGKLLLERAEAMRVPCFESLAAQTAARRRHETHAGH